MLEARALDAHSALEENECRAVRRGDQERGLDGRKSWWKPRDVTLVTPGSVAETSGRALDGRLACALTWLR
jgi:hypothetical protein